MSKPRAKTSAPAPAKKRPAKSRAPEPAPAAAKWPPCLLWQSADGKPMGIAAAAYEEIKAMWREVYYWAERTLRAAGMDAGRLPEPIWLRPSNWSPEMVAGLLYANNETAYRRAAPEAPATPPRLRPEWFEALVYLEGRKDRYPFAVDAGEVLRRCYVRELSQCGGAYDEECNVLWPLLGAWPQGADVDEERRAVIDIALAKHARNLARAMADGEAIANGWEPRAVFREDELEAKKRAADLVAAAIDRGRQCAAKLAGTASPRALTRAEVLDWLALEVRDRAPAPAMADAGPHAIDPQAVAAGKAAQAGPAMAAATKCRGGRPKGKAKAITNADFAEECGVVVRTVEGWNSRLREARERAKAQGKSDAQIAHVRIPIKRSGVTFWYYGLDQSASDKTRSPETFARAYNPKRFAER